MSNTTQGGAVPAGALPTTATPAPAPPTGGGGAGSTTTATAAASGGGGITITPTTARAGATSTASHNSAVQDAVDLSHIGPLYLSLERVLEPSEPTTATSTTMTSSTISTRGGKRKRVSVLLEVVAGENTMVDMQGLSKLDGWPMQYVMVVVVYS